MARPIRVEYEGASYHVMARGNERREIFRGEDDRGMFMKTMGEMVERFGIGLLGYVLMPNHFHLLLRTPGGNLSRGMGWLQTTYTIRFNRRHRRVGHLFQGRYRAQIVESDGYAQILVPYVHLNPIRSRSKEGPKITRDPRVLQSYQWSSHLDYTGTRKVSPVPLDWEWLKYWGRDPQEARKRYRQDLRKILTEGKVPDPWAGLEGQLVLGGEEFMEAIKSRLKGKKLGEESRWVEGRERAERDKLIHEWAGAETERRWQMWVRVKLGGQRPVDLAREFGYRDGGTVLQAIKRLERSAETEETTKKKMTHYRANLSRIKS